MEGCLFEDSREARFELDLLYILFDFLVREYECRDELPSDDSTSVELLAELPAVDAEDFLERDEYSLDLDLLDRECLEYVSDLLVLWLLCFLRSCLSLLRLLLLRFLFRSFERDRLRFLIESGDRELFRDLLSLLRFLDCFNSFLVLLELRDVESDEDDLPII